MIYFIKFKKIINKESNKMKYLKVNKVYYK